MEHVHKTYSCDRCKADLGEKLLAHSQECIVNAQFHWIDGPGPSFKWKDLCLKCREEIFAFFQPNKRD